MAVSVIDLDIPQGTTFTRVITISNQALVPINVTGYTFRAQIRKTYIATAITASFTFVILNQTTHPGQIRMELAPTALAGLSLNSKSVYVYDVEMVDVSLVVTRLFGGNVLITPEVTR